MRLLVTGGSGFIGSAVIRHVVSKSNASVVNIDKLTYAAMPEALEDATESERYSFRKLDICDAAGVNRLFEQFEPDAVMHLAAESHVDRSIDGPADFMQTNFIGTYTMLEAARRYWAGLSDIRKRGFRFHHVSTDEVYGSLEMDDPAFTEETPYSPRSPYSASKASSDHLARAWGETYGLPVVVTNCSNNYGPWQFPEKLIPVTIINAREGKPLPVYGEGKNVRDWLFVTDHAEALWTVLNSGRIGETYNIGGNAERRNIDVVRTICSLMDERFPDQAPHDRLITFVADRPGHDQRYAIDASKIKKELGWEPSISFEDGIAKTLDWYLASEEWWRGIREKRYDGRRLGADPAPSTVSV